MNQESIVACCAVCNQITHRRCARCLCVYYCNTEHQRQDWRRHKGECLPKLTNPHTSQEKVKNIGPEKVIQQDLTSAALTLKSVQREDTKTAGSGNVKRRSKKTKKKNGKKVYDKLTTQVLNNIAEKQNDVVASDASDETVKAGPSSKEASVISSVVYTNQELSQGSAITYEGSSEQEILSESAQQLNMVDFATPVTTDILRTVNMVDIAVPVQANYAVENVSRKEYPEASLRGATAPFHYTPNSYHVDTSDPSYIICQRVIKDMTKFGVCVIDNFFGKDRGANVLNEVKQMHSAGIFTPGQLVSNRDSTEPQTIRSDRITWIDGNEPECYHIRQLISQVDNIVLMANKVPDNGKMGDYYIKGRTKAMVACYPGSGSHYVKHVDNPNKDGRCITAIYYLNQDWDINKSGGLLRVFPSGTNKVADIAPIFDRMLFFWSDRRNPHEVQPAYDTRYAITLWYFDAQERAEARRNFMQRGQPSTSN